MTDVVVDVGLWLGCLGVGDVDVSCSALCSCSVVVFFSVVA